MMPGFDGFQVLDALQRLPGCREVPMFIWTSMLLTDNEYAILARSARAILGKGGGALQGVLLAEKFAVETACNALEAMRKVASVRPDLILMDIQMPGEDGLELTRDLKADAAKQHIRIVAFTAFAMSGDEARARAVGCDGYLSKPIDLRIFGAQVRACLEAPAGVSWGAPKIVC